LVAAEPRGERRPIIFLALIERYDEASQALAALPGLARAGGRRKPIRLPPLANIEREVEATMAAGAGAIALIEPDYPLALAAIADPPPVIVLKGHAHLLREPVVGIVGASNASANGTRLTRKLASDLGAAASSSHPAWRGGIDTAAHEGALATGTVAVVAGGIDTVYPPENALLQEQIGTVGAIIAETPIGTRPLARHFPRRNRLTSGISRGVLVVEAARRSGSLITARCALERGREVVAIPGSPLDPRSGGANHPRRQGAILTESAADIFDVLRGMSARSIEERRPSGPSAPTTPPADDEVARGRALVV
jgi:DNA processing protein